MASGRPEWPAAAGDAGIVWGYLGLSGIIAALVDASVREFGHTDLLQVNTHNNAWLSHVVGVQQE